MAESAPVPDPVELVVSITGVAKDKLVAAHTAHACSIAAVSLVKVLSAQQSRADLMSIAVTSIDGIPGGGRGFLPASWRKHLGLPDVPEVEPSALAPGVVPAAVPSAPSAPLLGVKAEVIDGA